MKLKSDAKITPARAEEVKTTLISVGRMTADTHRIKVTDEEIIFARESGNPFIRDLGLRAAQYGTLSFNQFIYLYDAFDKSHNFVSEDYLRKLPKSKEVTDEKLFEVFKGINPKDLEDFKAWKIPKIPWFSIKDGDVVGNVFIIPRQAHVITRLEIEYKGEITWIFEEDTMTSSDFTTIGAIKKNVKKEEFINYYREIAEIDLKKSMKVTKEAVIKTFWIYPIRVTATQNMSGYEYNTPKGTKVIYIETSFGYGRANRKIIYNMEGISKLAEKSLIPIQFNPQNIDKSAKFYYVDFLNNELQKQQANILFEEKHLEYFGEKEMTGRNDIHFQYTPSPLIQAKLKEMEEKVNIERKEWKPSSDPCNFPPDLKSAMLVGALGKTFDIKDALRKAGATWFDSIKIWVWSMEECNRVMKLKFGNNVRIAPIFITSDINQYNNRGHEFNYETNKEEMQSHLQIGINEIRPLNSAIRAPFITHEICTDRDMRVAYNILVKKQGEEVARSEIKKFKIEKQALEKNK